MGTTTLVKPDLSTFTLNTTNGMYAVPYADVPEDYGEDWVTDGVEIRRVVDVAWNNINNFLLDMLGWSENVSGQLYRHLPDAHPAAPSLYCVAARMIRNIGQPIIDGSLGFFNYYTLKRGDVDFATNLIASGKAPDPGLTRFALTYRKPPYPVLADDAVTSELERFVEKRYSYQVEHLPLAGTSFKFVDTGASAGLEKFPLRLPAKSLVYTWYGVPADPTTGLLPDALEANIEEVEGCVNDTTFEGRYAAGTLLCDAPETTRVQLATGDFAYNITYKMLFRRQGWNTKYRKQVTVAGPTTYAAGFYPITSTGGSSGPPYESKDFMKLFKLI